MKYEDELAALSVPFRVEREYAFEDCLVEVRRYFWSKPIERSMNALSDVLVINMALTSRPAHTRVSRIGRQPDPFLAEAGRLLIMIPGVSYNLVAPSGSFRSLHCAISCERFAAVAGEPIDWSALSGFGGESRSSLNIEAQVARIYDELVHRSIGWQEVIRACVDLICVELTRQFRNADRAGPEIHTGGLAAWRMRAILGRIHADGPAPRLLEIAQLCGLTERQLSRTFKAETGLTLGRVIAEATMERAHRLLTTTDMSIAAIAQNLGFAGADSFTQSFRRITGIPPSKARQR